MNLRLISTSVVLAVASGVFPGCASVRDSVRERFSAMPPQVRTYPGDPKQVFKAARRAMERFGYDLVGGGPAEGRLEGLTRISRGDDFASSRQRDIAIHLTPLGGDNVEVGVVIKEIEEDRFTKASNPATETPVRDPAVYDAFFAELARQLQGVAGK